MPFICVICFENLTPSQDHSVDVNEDTEIMVTTPCGHLFHKSCLNRGFEAAAARQSTQHGKMLIRLMKIHEPDYNVFPLNTNIEFMKLYSNICPTCNTSVDANKLVRIYPSEVDDELIEKLCKEINELKQSLNKLTEENSKLKQDNKSVSKNSNETVTSAKAHKPINQPDVKAKITHATPGLKPTAISGRVNSYLKNISKTGNDTRKDPPVTTTSNRSLRNFLQPQGLTKGNDPITTPKKTYSVSINGKDVREDTLIAMIHRSPSGDTTEELGTIKKILDVNNTGHFAILMENPVGDFSGVFEGKKLFECPLNCGMLVPVMDFIQKDKIFKVLN